MLVYPAAFWLHHCTCRCKCRCLKELNVFAVMLLFPEGCCWSLSNVRHAQAGLSFQTKAVALHCCKEEGLHLHMKFLQHHRIAPTPPFASSPTLPHAPSLPLPRRKDQLSIGIPDNFRGTNAARNACRLESLVEEVSAHAHDPTPRPSLPAPAIGGGSDRAAGTPNS